MTEHEHKPMTDEEIAEAEKTCCGWHDSPTVETVGGTKLDVTEFAAAALDGWPRALAEVRRLRGMLERNEGRAKEVIDDALLTKIRMLEDRLSTLDRVLVNTHYPFGTGCLRRSVVLVTAVGENTFLGREIAATVGVIKVDVPDEINPGEHDWNPALGYREGKNDTGWRPWSEVYPDRPVPGGGE